MDSSSHKISLGEAVSQFLGGLPPEEAKISQQVLYQFVRWFGRERCLADIRAPEIANYSGRISATDADHAKKQNIIRGFLALARKKGWTENNLSVHLKAKNGKPHQVAGNRQGLPETVSLTQRGYDEMNRELSALKERRPETVEDIRRAAADKDFRENAPLDAAREQLGYIDGRIRGLEETLKLASIIDDRAATTHQAGIGDCVLLIDFDSGEEVGYTIVSPKEVDPARGRISNTSPLGRAIVGRDVGEVIEITVPAGTLRYRIERVGRW
ncbi:MAG: transcription elongation factor GreA [Dehalococcoidales bacterium]|nr:transcription elongation factor GreA [Dehalococcoidales bacterium]